MHPTNLFPNFPMERIVRTDGDYVNHSLIIPQVSLDSRSLNFVSDDAVDWKRETGSIFSPLENFKSSKTSTISCPRCDSVFSHRQLHIFPLPLHSSSCLRTAWLLPSGEGYAHHRFVSNCPSCHLPVTKEAIGLGHLIRELVGVYEVTDIDLA
jgi:hypothetical protein